MRPYGKIVDDGKEPDAVPAWIPDFPSTTIRDETTRIALRKILSDIRRNKIMAIGAKIAKTADRKKVMDTTKSTDCPKCGKPTRIVKRVKDRERGVPGGVYISCSACEFFEKL
jgi:DNA-directed RNA polymerase subunit M/transcription elongation factor TFIIS